MKKSQQSGFGIIEMFLALVLLIGLAVIGYTVWKTNHDNQKTDSLKLAQTTPAKPASVKTFAECKAASGSKIKQTSPEQCVFDGKTFTDQSTSSQSLEQDYLVINKWGVKIKMRNAEKIDITVSNTPSDGSDAYDGNYDGAAAPKFKAQYLQDKTCEPGVALFRATKPDTSFGGTRVGDYYYWVTGGPGACNDAADNNLKTQFLQDFKPKNMQLL